MVKMEEKNMPRKGENIYKRKDGRWEARYIYSFKEDGSPRYRSIYAADYLTVKKKQNDAKRKMDPRLFQSVRMKKNISFYGLLWLERLKPSSKESTYVRYHYLFSHYISPMIGDRLVYTFSNKDCEVFLNRLLVSGKRDGSGLAPKTVTDIRSVVKLILKTAEKEGELSLCNPELCPVKPVKKPLRILSLKEQQALQDYLLGNLTHKNIGSLNDQNQVILKEMKESGVLGEGLEGVEFLAQRQWEKDGTSWIYYNGNQDNDILDIQTGRAIALIDCKNGYFYFWDNQLCTFCTINMEKFLYLEKNELENADKECMNVHRNISIYYKGIILEEIEVSDLGNELIQSIDIKGKLAREYINLNRKGLTEMGRLYFKDEIYKKLLESIHDTLKKINRKHKEKLVDTICGSLEYKKKLVRRIDELLMEQDMLKPMLDLDKYAKMNQTIAIQDMKKDMDGLR